MSIETMTVLAEAMNGRQYGQEVPAGFSKVLADAGCVAIYGASDDLTEFSGAINDEAGAYNGAEHRMTKTGMPESKCDEGDDCPYFRKAIEALPTIKAEWDVHGYSWFISTTLPYATFNILEDDETFCRGIIISLDDLPDDFTSE